jgi:hypothetical protein
MNSDALCGDCAIIIQTNQTKSYQSVCLCVDSGYVIFCGEETPEIKDPVSCVGGERWRYMYHGDGSW